MAALAAVALILRPLRRMGAVHCLSTPRLVCNAEPNALTSARGATVQACLPNVGAPAFFNPGLHHR